jgi:hypothetical protein
MWAVFAASGVVLGAAYMLFLYQRTMFGKIENPKNERLLDITHREFVTFAPLIVLAVWMGTTPFLRRLETSGSTSSCGSARSTRPSTRSATRADRGRDCPVDQPARRVPLGDSLRRERESAAERTGPHVGEGRNA